MSKNLKFLLIALFFSMPLCWEINVLQKNTESHITAQISAPLQETKRPEINIDALAALSLEIGADGKKKTLYKKNENESLPIASLTKLMSALIILEDPENFNLSKAIIISENAAGQGDTPNYGNLKSGEKYTIEKLLNLTLIYSSNDAVFALAEINGEDNFVSEMNEKAKEIGLKETNFVNPHGLDNATLNLSSASDLAILAEYILKNKPLVFEISSKSYSADSIENGISKLILKEGQKIIGGKTGYTKIAKGCMLFVFQNENNSTFVNVILGTETEEGRVAQMQKLINRID